MMGYREDQDVRVDNIESRGIIFKDDKVLIMFRRRKGIEYYVFPGGHMQEGETPLENATREIFEETTIRVKDMELAFSFKNYAKPKKIEEEYYFVGHWESGDPVISGEESRRMSDDNYFEPMWMDLDVLRDKTLYPAMAKEWLEISLEKFFEKRK